MNKGKCASTNNLNSIGQRIKYLRKKVAGTQKAFAKDLGMSQSCISELESNRYKPSEQITRNICHTFSINHEWLEHGQGEIEAPEPLFSYQDISRARISQITRVKLALEELKGVEAILKKTLEGSRRWMSG